MQMAAARQDGYDERDGTRRQHEALDRLRAGARVYGESGDDAVLRDAARAIAADAADRGFRAEELVIAFKQLWTSVPELSPMR
ncbi:hypothetical protein, partial [Klebsiella pneumoniae]|uniref:hypothetical protein n=1 Tax=Klebsiella pneumoniae TaxID=573 RepID=UPI00254B6FA8